MCNEMNEIKEIEINKGNESNDIVIKEGKLDFDDVIFYLGNGILSIDELMDREIKSWFDHTDDLLFWCLQHKIVSMEFIQKYEPHIIRFGNLPFITCVRVDGEWVVFNIWNCKREYLTLYKELLTTQYEKSKVVGYSVKKAPIPKELYYYGIKETRKQFDKDCTCDLITLPSLFHYLEPVWMYEYKNIKCFRVKEDQSLIQVSLSKIDCLNVNKKESRIKNEQFSDTTPTLSDDEYHKYYDIV